MDCFHISDTHEYHCLISEMDFFTNKLIEKGIIPAPAVAEVVDTVEESQDESPVYDVDETETTQETPADEVEESEPVSSTCENTDIEPVASDDVEQSTPKQGELVEVANPQYILKMFTNKARTEVHLPSIYKDEIISEDIFVGDYIYKMYNIGKVRISKKGKGSASINFLFSKKPTLTDIAAAEKFLLAELQKQG